MLAVILGRVGAGAGTVDGGAGGGAAGVASVDGSSLMQRGNALLHWPVARQVSKRGPSMR